MPFYGPHTIQTRKIISENMKAYAMAHPNWNHIKETLEKQMIRPMLLPSKDLAYIIGVLLGDGYVTQSASNSPRVCLASISKDFILTFRAALKNIGLHPSKVYIDNRKIYHTVAVSKIFVEWYKGLTLIKIKKIIDNYKLAFIKGFYESEGTLFLRKSNHRFDIGISNSNLMILRLISKFLHDLNIRNAIYERGRTVNNLQMYNLRIYEGDVKHFLYLIRPCIKYLSNNSIIKDYV